MEWAQFLILIMTIGGLFLWLRSESNSDRRDMVNIILSMKEDGNHFREQWTQESKDFREKWAQESKDFHARLCVIEQERNRILAERR